MSIETALFLVQDYLTKELHHVTGADIAADKVYPLSWFLVQRGTQRFSFFLGSSNTHLDQIQDDDLFLVWENNQNYHVTGQQFKELFEEPFDYDECMLDARAAYLDTMTKCESRYCCDIAYREYKKDIDDCHAAAGLPPPDSYPAPRPCRA